MISKITSSGACALAGLFACVTALHATPQLCPLTLTATVNQKVYSDSSEADKKGNTTDTQQTKMVIAKFTNKDLLTRLVTDGLISSVKGYALYVYADPDEQSYSAFAIRNAAKPTATDFDVVKVDEYIDISSFDEVAASATGKYVEVTNASSDTISKSGGYTGTSAINGVQFLGGESPFFGNLTYSTKVGKFVYHDDDGAATTVFWDQIGSASFNLQGGIYNAVNEEYDYTGLMIKLGAGVYASDGSIYADASF